MFRAGPPGELEQGGTMRSKLTYANVMSTLAVFLLLAGGGAVAAQKLKKNSVKTKNIRNKAVTEAKIGDQAVTNPKIGDKQVKTGKLGEGSVTGAKIEDGAVAPAKTSFAVKSGRVASNPAALQVLTPTLLSAGGVTLSASCLADAADSVHQAKVRLTGPANAFYSGTESGDGIPVHDVTSSLPDDVGTDLQTAGGARKNIQLQVVTPTGALSLSIIVAVNQAGDDCVFSAIGSAG
jgi:hypothetical protein